MHCESSLSQQVIPFRPRSSDSGIKKVSDFLLQRKSVYIVDSPWRAWRAGCEAGLMPVIKQKRESVSSLSVLTVALGVEEIKCLSTYP